MELASSLGLTFRRNGCSPRSSLYTADEVFLTGTAAEVIPVVKIDARPIGSRQRRAPRRQRLIDGVPRNSPSVMTLRFSRVFINGGTYLLRWGVVRKRSLWTG
jgi:hypothetical protein